MVGPLDGKQRIMSCAVRKPVQMGQGIIEPPTGAERATGLPRPGNPCRAARTTPARQATASAAPSAVQPHRVPVGADRVEVGIAEDQGGPFILERVPIKNEKRTCQGDEPVLKSGMPSVGALRFTGYAGIFKA